MQGIVYSRKRVYYSIKAIGAINYIHFIDKETKGLKS